MNKAVLDRLVRIKGTLRCAETLLENPAPLDCAVALLLMDSVVESAMKLSLDGESLEGVDLRRDPKFNDILEKACSMKELDELRQSELQLSYMHTARNGFQHQGIVPDSNIVKGEYLGLTYDVLQLISKKRFGVDWGDISLASMIRDEEIRKLYLESEKLVSNGDFAGAAATIIYAFELTKNVARLTIQGSGIQWYRWAAYKDNTENYLRNYILALDKEIETFKLGLDYIELRNYLDVAEIAGVEGILYSLPDDKSAVDVIADFKAKLAQLSETSPPSAPSPLWCRQAQDTLLNFVVRTESVQRAFTKQVREYYEALAARMEREEREKRIPRE